MIQHRIRLASKSDLDDLAWVLVAASPDDPNYAYRSPQRDVYPEDFAAHCRLKCSEYLASNQVVVFESPLRSDPEKRRVVAFSVWDRQHPGKHGRNISLDQPLVVDDPSTSPTSPHAARRDADPNRMSAFRDACATAKLQLFDSRYTRGHMFLKILLCHPDYRCRGAGTALTSWGVRQARRRGLSTTLFSSPMGYPLYCKLGFKEIGHFRVQVAGDDAYLDIPALMLAPPPRAAMSQRRRTIPLPQMRPTATAEILPPMVEVH